MKSADVNFIAFNQHTETFHLVIHKSSNITTSIVHNNDVFLGTGSVEHVYVGNRFVAFFVNHGQSTTSVGNAVNYISFPNKRFCGVR